MTPAVTPGAIRKGKTMANKKHWLGMSVMALVFGLILTGCDIEESLFGPGDNPFIGTWENSSSVYFTFKKDAFTYVNSHENLKGAYSHDGNKATLYFDTISGSSSIQINNGSFTYESRKFTYEGKK